jgi:hypothetical protein
VQIADGGKNLAHDFPGGHLAVATLLNYAVEEVSTLQQLHHNVDAMLRLERI